MTPCRPWAAFSFLLVGLTVAGASWALPLPDAGASGDAGPARAEDAGRLAGFAPGDGGTELDLEVVENLDLLEHLDEAQLLELLLPVRDE